MKKVTLSAIALVVVGFLASCDNTGQNNQRNDDTTTFGSPAAPIPPTDTTMNDTLMDDTLGRDRNRL
ncbi:hypothetical protein ACFOET_05240 [Parapedobacter deserti]|uniref:Lipoprotein n=1 Tax=Parapedobacter deserti TaxID=1912957 RepID=A0ABV7JG03_9SPHI